MGTFDDWELVVGLEVHAQLLTRTKAFCGCATSFGEPPNTHTCPVCLGLPGALPVLNREALRMAVSAALALGCSIQKTSVFARKNYFYPDLPKGYQISQYDLPLALHGALEIESGEERQRIGILRVHMEEDAGKNVHSAGEDSVVDLNRAGTPLIEIVGDPDLRSGPDAAEYLKRLREVLMFLGVNDGNLEQGSFRCDANVSVRMRGVTSLGTRTELKNLNSFRFVAEAIDVEARRQIELLEGGHCVRQQTRGYNAEKKETYLLRDKENESGYRYFPEPDLPPLVVEPEFAAAIRSTLPLSPLERRRRLVDRGLTPAAAAVITSHPGIAAFFDAAQGRYAGAVKLANYVQSEVLADVKLSGLEATFPVTPAQVTDLLELVDRGTISGKQAKEVYAAMRGTESSPGQIVRERGMHVIVDEDVIVGVARAVLAQNPKQAAAFRGGKTALLGFFVGQVMKLTGGSAAPAVVNAVLARLLNEAEGAPPADAAAADAGPITSAPPTAAPPTAASPVAFSSTPPPAMTRPSAAPPEVVRPSAAPPPPRAASAPPPVEADPQPLGPSSEAASPPELARHSESPSTIGRSALAALQPPTGIALPQPPTGIAPPQPIVISPSASSERSPVVRKQAPVARTLTSAEKSVPILRPAEDPTPVAPPQREVVTSTIPLDHFSQVDLRVGLIVSAERAVGKEWLFDLRIDVGDALGPRQIIADLALAYLPLELVGKLVLVAVNVEPRVFSKELVSHGMLLSAGPADAIALATVSRDVAPGTRMR